MNQVNTMYAVAGLVLAALGCSTAALAQVTKSPDATAAAGAPATPPLPVAPSPLFASVNGKPVTQAEFDAAFSAFLRQKFYHGQVPQDQLLTARQEVEDQVISRVLLLDEIEKRGIKPDTEDVEKQVASYDKRYAPNPNWQKSRETMLPGLRSQLARQSRLASLEKAVRDVPVPSADQVKAFYASRPELFTEPEKLRLRTILLAVAPSSAQQVWDAAISEAETIVKRLRNGTDFAEQARLSSNDSSAEQGGDMGYVHVGMLPEALQAKIDQFKLGEVGEPVQTLQGIGIFRVEDRIAPVLQPFERVAERARDLLHRENKDKAWKDFLSKLKSDAKIVIQAPGKAAASVK